MSRSSRCSCAAPRTRPHASEVSHVRQVVRHVYPSPADRDFEDGAGDGPEGVGRTAHACHDDESGRTLAMNRSPRSLFTDLCRGTNWLRALRSEVWSIDRPRQSCPGPVGSDRGESRHRRAYWNSRLSPEPRPRDDSVHDNVTTYPAEMLDWIDRGADPGRQSATAPAGASLSSLAHAYHLGAAIFSWRIQKKSRRTHSSPKPRPSSPG